MKFLTPKQLSDFILICNHFTEDKYRKTTEVTYSLRHKQKFSKYFPHTRYGERKMDYKIPTLLDDYCQGFLNEENLRNFK